MPKPTDRMIDYCFSIAGEFESRMNRLRVFVPHNVSSGNANELILRDFLASHAPGDYHVGQGFICDPSEENKVSRQCDILVYHQNAVPLVYSDGPIKVVWPEAARIVIEVKTTLNGDSLADALQNIEAAKKLSYYATGIIFAFQSLEVETVIKHLESYPRHLPGEYGPTAILLLDKGVIVHRWGWAHESHKQANGEDDSSMYNVLTARTNGRAIVVAFLLLLFFEVTGSRHLYSSSMINMLMNILKEYTDKRAKDVYIGQRKPEEPLEAPPSE